MDKMWLWHPYFIHILFIPTSVRSTRSSCQWLAKPGWTATPNTGLSTRRWFGEVSPLRNFVSEATSHRPFARHWFLLSLLPCLRHQPLLCRVRAKSVSSSGIPILMCGFLSSCAEANGKQPLIVYIVVTQGMDFLIIKPKSVFNYSYVIMLPSLPF